MRHMRGFVDYVVFKLCQEKPKINRYIEILDILIWTYNLFPLEKIILVMAMRNYEGEQLHTCYRLMQLLLLVPANFRFRLKEFLNSENSPSYWSQPEQLNDHLDYHADKPEYFNFEGLRARASGELFGNDVILVVVVSICTQMSIYYKLTFLFRQILLSERVSDYAGSSLCSGTSAKMLP